MERTPHALVVDDDEDVRVITRLSLEVAGWVVSEAASGAEALAQCAAEAPDVVLLDVMMPQMDGPTTFAALQADSTLRSVPVVYLTAKAEPAERERLRRTGVMGVMSKPFDPLTLADSVSNLLGWKS